MEKFEIHIGKIYDLESKTEKPKQIMIITREQFAVIEGLKEFTIVHNKKNLKRILNN